MGALALTDCSAALSWALAKVRCIFANDHRIVSGSFSGTGWMFLVVFGMAAPAATTSSRPGF
jgi:hypothetical protein